MEAPTDNTDLTAMGIDDGFAVTDESSANWVVRKVREARAYADRVRAWAAAELRRAEREEQALLARFGPQLEAWCRATLAQRGRRSRSVLLPAGRIGFRLSREAVEIKDAIRAIEWCRTNLPDAAVTTQRLRLARLREYVLRTGELAIGADLRPGRDGLYIGS